MFAQSEMLTRFPSSITPIVEQHAAVHDVIYGEIVAVGELDEVPDLDVFAAALENPLGEQPAKTMSQPRVLTER